MVHCRHAAVHAAHLCIVAQGYGYATTSLQGWTARAMLDLHVSPANNPEGQHGITH